MQNSHPVSASALAIRAHYRQSESRSARLRLLVDTGQELTQLTTDAMRERVLTRACAFLAMDHGVLLEWDAEGRIRDTARYGHPTRLDALLNVVDRNLLAPFWQAFAEDSLPGVLQVPLMSGDGITFGALMFASSVGMSAPDNDDSESLQLLATLLAAHLENDRLLTTLIARDRTLSDLLSRLLRAQEDERKRVAYDLHDGLAQTLTGLHQRLQGFAGRCPILPDTLDADLQAILTLAQHCVGEGRQLIAGLRPAVLDDFGLHKAVDKEADRLREVGIKVQWLDFFDTRMSNQVEIALFRIAQEAINNILKHAHANHVQLALRLLDGHVWLSIEDNGKGFDLEQKLDTQDARHLGLTTMHERASLLGGRLTCVSTLNSGTQLRTTVPTNPDGATQ
ncbi:sensor histidine kinase [Pseudomonas sp. FSL R10-1350]|uniref:sensor histidine kinase n=1 Tax=Pseudomonas sp. FSL R10-1350 TaxID=2662197 RepID=UPI001295DA07|nr:sensor histidine kinase [Pseudomonas sp. FSL R10-1350]MQU65465.1 sensor histidine kinase [Pseudomonas sp. FSL R10-1350]